MIGRYIEITEDEAWAINLSVRHTYAEGGSVIGQELLLKAMYVILEFEDRRQSPMSPAFLPIAVTEEESWALDHQIRCDLTINNRNVGRALLVKVFRVLTSYASERDAHAGVTQLHDLADLLRPDGTTEPDALKDSGSHPTPADGADPKDEETLPPATRGK